MRVADSSLFYVLKLSKPIAKAALQPERLKYFDKDGFELTPLEQAIYKKHNIPLGEHLYHHCCQLDWFVQDEQPQKGLVVDHSMILHRFSISGELRDQIEQQAKTQPVFKKLLALQEKWGVDLSLEFLDEHGVTEVFHAEVDSRDRDEVQAIKERLENLVFNTNWKDVAREIQGRRAEWNHLSADDQNDWRAALLGFKRAYDVKKVW